MMIIMGLRTVMIMIDEVVNMNIMGMMQHFNRSDMDRFYSNRDQRFQFLNSSFYFDDTKLFCPDRAGCLPNKNGRENRQINKYENTP
jgi:hypothetical protein